MTDRSPIEWTQATWNPVTGCDRISPGCDHCYALTLARRLKAMGQAKYQTDGRPPTSGPGFGVAVHPQALTEPLRWQQPRLIFVNSMSDLFHARVPDTFIAQVFAVMAAASHHSFQVLTKRPQRMARLLGSDAFAETVFHLSAAGYGAATLTWPLPNLWLGTSVEDQKRANQRIPKLLATPTAIRFLSCEPLLGPIDLQPEWVELEIQAFGDNGAVCFPRVDWIIVGGESGPGARPMHPAWARSLRDQAVAADVAFFFKQWGAFAPEAAHAWRWPDSSNRGGLFLLDPRGNGWTWRPGLAPPDTVRMRQVGKHRAGRLLDGCTWDQYPTTWGGAPTGQGPGAR